MNSRSLLRAQIKDAWNKSISTDYVAQRINSERSLQASMWSNLNKLLPPKTRRTFIEPGMTISGRDRLTRYPDLVVCNSREVIGIVELKYQPNGQPTWQKDISTFSWINTNKSQIFVSNSRFRGVAADTRIYPLAENILFVWAGVHIPCELQISDYIGVDLVASFLELHAETHHLKQPQIR